jgi:hypothetical protein
MEKQKQIANTKIISFFFLEGIIILQNLKEKRKKRKKGFLYKLK